MALDIKSVIKRHNLEAREVARRMGITPSGFSSHVNGNPSAEVLERIAEAIGCTVGEFFTDYREPRPFINTLECPYCGNPIALHPRKTE